ncbi:TetR family transcriptional regulator [Mycobacterium sp. MFM001]|uniref:TetR/AcrR family transcriptional regulator n=1 Tax=Mycobacterium sp. MFM001 TaxID=2049453 RepID=UPI000DA56117|nr:TetR/AcrR family transcriptional regulator [Mycobacterium sp. MFM001]GBE65512.1 TetR family transcriptional regulator [Mycobacterium sp. MFM001]
MTTPTDQRISDAAVRLFVEKGTTQLTISELAQAANVARGTLYRNIGSVSDLFDRVVAEFSADLHQRVSASFAGIDDPAARLATGVRLWVRYAHENPTLGRFAVKFGLSEESLRAVMTGPPMRDISAGVAAGRYDFGSLGVDSIASLVLGATVSAMWMVLEGHQTWREAGSSTAELLLRAMGIEPGEAHEISMVELPRLSTA